MRFYPILPLFVVVPIAITAIVLLVLCLSKKGLRKTKNIRRVCMLILVAIILARPVFFGGQSQKESNNLNFFFVVDATTSMTAEDVEGNSRYVKVAKDINDIVNEFPGSRYSVIIEDNKVYTPVPMTTNTEFVSSIWNNNAGENTNKAAKGLVAPKSSFYSNGTDLNTLLVKAGEHVHYYAKKAPSRVNIFFLMTDGDNSNGGSVSTQSALREDIGAGFVFGYGSTAGGTVLDTSSTDYGDTCQKYGGSDASIKVNSRGCVISSINEKLLNQIAENHGYKYFHRESGGIPSEVASLVSEKQHFSGSDESADSFMDIYWIFGMVLIVLLLWDFREVLDSVMKEREFKHA